MKIRLAEPNFCYFELTCHQSCNGLLYRFDCLSISNTLQINAEVIVARLICLMYSLLQAVTEHEKETRVVGETPLISLPSFFFPNPRVPSRFYNVRAWNRLLDYATWLLVRSRPFSVLRGRFASEPARWLSQKTLMTNTPA